MGYFTRVAGQAVTPDGKRLVSGSWGKTRKVWDLWHGASECGSCYRLWRRIQGIRRQSFLLCSPTGILAAFSLVNWRRSLQPIRAGRILLMKPERKQGLHW